MSANRDSLYRLNRRAFLGRHAGALGTLALAHLLDGENARRSVRAAEADVQPPGLSGPASPALGRNR